MKSGQDIVFIIGELKHKSLLMQGAAYKPGKAGALMSMKDYDTVTAYLWHNYTKFIGNVDNKNPYKAELYGMNIIPTPALEDDAPIELIFITEI